VTSLTHERPGQTKNIRLRNWHRKSALSMALESKKSGMRSCQTASWTWTTPAPTTTCTAKVAWRLACGAMTTPTMNSHELLRKTVGAFGVAGRSDVAQGASDWHRDAAR